MKSTLLLPRNCRIAGLVLLPLFIALFIAVFQFGFLFSFLATHHPNDMVGNNNLTDEVATAGILISLFLIAFSRLRHEDEYTGAIRLRSLQIGVYANYAIFIIMTFMLYGADYLAVVFYNVATILILFIAVFNFNLYIRPRLSKTLPA